MPCVIATPSQRTNDFNPVCNRDLDRDGTEEQWRREIATAWETFHQLPDENQVFIQPAPLLRDAVTRAVTNHVFPRYFWPKAWRSMPLAERRERDKLYQRVRQTYRNLRTIAATAHRHYQGGYLDPRATKMIVNASCCRLPGFKAGPDQRFAHISLDHLPHCKQPFICPSCLWRRLLKVGTDVPGPAYKIAWAIQQGIPLAAFRLKIASVDFDLAHEAACELSKRLRGSVHPQASWRCLRPDLLTFPSTADAVCADAPGWELRVLLAGVDCQRVLQGWAWFERHQDYVRAEVCKHRPKMVMRKQNGAG